MAKQDKVLIIGLDCATPQLVFDQYLERLPNLKSLLDNGIWGEALSVIPPITVPAWASMFSGVKPGKLGFYGFRNRKPNSYDLSIVTSKSWRQEAVWDYLGEAGFKSIVIGVPPSYPPKQINGNMISCFLTPGPDSEYAYPSSLKEEIQRLFGDYIFDVRKFRTDDKDYLLKQIYEMTNQRFEVAKHLLKSKEWDLFVMVEMGPDRLHHGFWKFFDPQHPKYEPNNKFENVALDYYSFLDGKIGELLRLVDDSTTVIVISDHGAKAMVGGICINEWLIKEGYLTLKEYPSEPRRINSDDIDWSRTVAWGEGGYYGRVFLNVKGREPQGIVDPLNLEKMKRELKEAIENIPDEEGNPIGTVVYAPEEIYDEINGFPPDLIVLFGNLDWRSAGTVGFKTVWVYENDTGPDDANHALEGIFVMRSPHIERRGKITGFRIFDLAPTLLDLFGLKIEGNFDGKSILNSENIGGPK